MIGSNFQYAKHEDVPAYDNAERWVNSNGDLEIKLYYHGNMVLHLAESDGDAVEDAGFYGSAYNNPRKEEQSREDKLNGTSIYEIHERNDGSGNAVFTQWSESTDELAGKELQARTMHNVVHLDKDIERRALIPLSVVFNEKDERKN